LWTRVQEPTGTTNMDFELNQKFCDTSATPTNCAPNGITPLRTVGDKLITYDLDRGGTRATISIRTWTNGGVWGPATVLTAQNPVQALGTINSSQITAANSLSTLGALSPRTFGEASINLTQVLGTAQCVTFGSAFLKSRSADSFTSAVKDFIAPQRVTVTNCGEVLINKTDDADAPLDGAVFELYKDTDPSDGATGHEAEDVATGKSCETVDGTCTIGSVAFGQYWVVETHTPSGYSTAADQAATISAAVRSVSLSFVDVRQKGGIHITKRDDGGNLLNGITFTVSQGGLSAGSCTTGSGQNPAGECTISNLVIGTYSLSEGSLPSGYSSDPTLPRDVVVTSNVITQVSVVNPRLHKIITIVCHEGSNELMSVDATLGSTTVQTMGTVPAALSAKTVTQADLCGISAGTFDHLSHGTKAVSVAIDTHP
jgi:uncharacterized surface anchored protein